MKEIHKIKELQTIIRKLYRVIETQKKKDKIKELQTIIKKQKNIIEKQQKEIDKLTHNVTRLRVKDIAQMYSISESTVLKYTKEKKLIAKRHSPKVMTFSAKQVKQFFKKNGRINILDKVDTEEKDALYYRKKAKSGPKQLLRKIKNSTVNKNDEYNENKTIKYQKDKEAKLLKKNK